MKYKITRIGPLPASTSHGESGRQTRRWVAAYAGVYMGTALVVVLSEVQDRAFS